MSSPSQVTANRLNAQHSTGPVTPEGKAASSRNALKSGLHSEAALLPGESPDAFKELQSEYTQRYQPTTPDQRFYVDQMIRNEWLLRRFARIEESLWFGQLKSINPKDPAAIGDLYEKAGPVFTRLERRVRAAEKAYQKAHDELVRLQKPASNDSAPSTQHSALISNVSAPGTQPSALSPELGSFRQPAPSPALAAAAPPHAPSARPEES